ncbi:MAG: response regulator [Actinobacteria bacterium]|jgi:DNA-binding NarL/FixJ family response regulator|nr:response regulator [Actinomycetota bacterium]
MGEWQRRVLVVEDQGVMRGLVRDLFERSGFETLAVASAAEAFAAFAEFDPDALVADIDLGSRPDGAELALTLRRLAPHLGVLFLSSYPRNAAGHDAFGIHGAVFVNKTGITSPGELVEALERALHSSTGSAVAAETGRGAALAALTRHQLEVLSMIAQGWSNERIAEQSGASPRAVERTVSRIFDRLEISGDRALNQRVAAAALYLSEFGPAR